MGRRASSARGCGREESVARRGAHASSLAHSPGMDMSSPGALALACEGRRRQTTEPFDVPYLLGQSATWESAAATGRRSGEGTQRKAAAKDTEATEGGQRMDAMLSRARGMAEDGESGLRGRE